MSGKFKVSFDFFELDARPLAGVQLREASPPQPPSAVWWAGGGGEGE